MRPIDVALLEAGYCTHPACVALPGAGFAKQEFPALAALLKHPQLGVILFDTGYSEHFLRATRSFPESLYPLVTPVHFNPEQAVAAQLRRRAIAPTDVRLVFLSHFHGDHVGGVLDFPAADILCSRAGWIDLRKRGRLSALQIGLLPSLVPASLEGRVRFIEDCAIVALPSRFAPHEAGHDIAGDGSLIAVELPGHAIGHFGLIVIGAAERDLFLVGDAAWSSRAIRELAPPPACVTGWLGDTQLYRATLNRLHELGKRSPGIAIVPSHCLEFRP